jgi:hypothetical protein
VAKWLGRARAAKKAKGAAVSRAPLLAHVQCDETWSFVGKKESRRVYGDKNYHQIGDAWTFIAIERNTKLVLASTSLNGTP